MMRIFSALFYAALPLILASCGGGAREVVVEQSEEGYYTEVREDIDPDFLCEAAKNGNVREARFLLDNGADPNALCSTTGLYTKAGCTVFGIGLMITAPLVGNCWEPDTPPLFLAVQGGHDEIVRALLASGANPNHAAKSGATPLLEAARRKNSEIARALLEGGANPNQAGRRHPQVVKVGRKKARIFPIPMHIAALYSPEMVPLLLAHGAAADAESLILAVIANSGEAVQMLLNCGANPGAGDIKGVRNAWDFARDNPVMLGILDRWLEEAKAGTWEKSCPQKAGG